MKKSYLLLAMTSLFTFTAQAQGSLTPAQTEAMNKLLEIYAQQASVEVKDYQGRGVVSDKPFSAEVGHKFFLTRRTWQSHDFTCSGCHTVNPKKPGMHILSKKAIKPLAPAANPDRFTDFEKVEANFKAHCLDLYERECTAYEKGNFIAYLMSIK